MPATLYKIESERLDPDDVLSSAQGELETVIVAGRTLNGEFYLASNLSDKAHVLWLLEQCKLLLLDIDE